MKGKKLIAVCVLVCVALPMAPSLAQEPQPGEETGKKVGTIVKTAINTFLPAVGPLIDAIWPTRANGQKKGKATEDEVKKKLEEQAGKLKAEAQGKIKPIESVANELKTLLKFLDPSVQAQPRVIAAITRLSSSTQPSVDDWTFVIEEFNIANDFIATIKTVEDHEIRAVGSAFLRDKLKRIRQANLDLLGPIKSAITNKNRDQSVERLGRLEERLRGVSDAVGYLVADMQGDLEGLANWAKGAAGDGTSEHLAMFESRLDEAYPPD